MGCLMSNDDLATWVFSGNLWKAFQKVKNVLGKPMFSSPW